MNRIKSYVAILITILAITLNFACGRIKLGSVHVHDEVSIQLNSTREVSALQGSGNTSSLTASSGQVYLISNITLTNKSQAPVNFLTFQVLLYPATDTDAPEFGVVTRAGDTYTNFSSIASSIPAGGSITGDVVHEVVTGTKPDHYAIYLDKESQH